MRAGRLNRRVYLQNPPASRHAVTGQVQPNAAWTTTATLWAAIEPTEGTERWEAARAQSGATHVVTIRYRSGVTSNQRFLFGTRKLNIVGIVNPREKREQLQCLCREDIAV